MTLLQIEHRVPDYKEWKKAFDNDPMDRKGAGVRRFSSFHLSDDPDYIIIQLEFDNMKDAIALLERLKKMWQPIEGKIIIHPVTRIMEQLDHGSN